MSKPFDAVLVVAFGGPQGPRRHSPFSCQCAARPAHIGRTARGSRWPLRTLRRRLSAHGHHDEAGARPRVAPVGTRFRTARVCRDAQLASVPDRHAPLDGRRRCPPRDWTGARGTSLVFELHAVPAERSSMRAPSFVLPGLQDVSVIYVGDWHTHQKFVEANARHVAQRHRAAAWRHPFQRRRSCSPRTACRLR